MTPLEELLREKIRHRGPLRFAEFMELALYHPEHGYYRSDRDPFGRAGDYYTAEQLQPVYGILMAQLIERLCEAMGRPREFAVAELGAGRAEMAEAFARWRFVPVEFGKAHLPPSLTGVVFANEFFDALPVEQVVRREDHWRLMRVDWRDGFVWTEGEPVEGEVARYLDRFVPPQPEGVRVEVHLEGLRWLERIAQVLKAGFVVIVDYGYTTRELPRLAQGTLMAYRRHRAEEDVLAEPGRRDITSHVPFSALIEYGAGCGLRAVRFASLAATLLEAGERDGFAAALQASDTATQLARRLQLKTLLFGLGETFRALVLEKTPERERGRK